MGIVAKKPHRSLRIALEYWWPARLTLKCNPPIYAWLWWNFDWNENDSVTKVQELVLKKKIEVYQSKLGECKLSLNSRNNLLRYITKGQSPGNFLLAVLENNLIATAKWSNFSKERLWGCIDTVTEHCPPESWGSKDKVAAWIKQGGLLKVPVGQREV